MRDVPDVAGQKMAISARHHFFLEVVFRLQKATAKLLNDAFYDTLGLLNQKVALVRPAKQDLKHCV